jgi:hypothetical protein
VTIGVGAVAKSIKLVFWAHEDPHCGGISEIQVVALR